MTILLAHRFGAVLACGLVSSAAWADLSAQDVWADWQSYLAETGYDVTGTPQQSGDTLVVSDLSVSMTLQDPVMTLGFAADSVTFGENGDGSVTVGLPLRMPLTIAGQNDDGERFESVFDYTHSGLSMVVSGDPGDLTYTYGADEVDLTLTTLTVDGVDLVDHARIAVSLNDIAGSTRMLIGAARSYEQSMTAGGLSYNMAFDNPESDERASFVGMLNGLEFDGAATLPADLDTADFPAMMQAGFAVDGRFGYTSGQTDIDGAGNGEEFAFSSTSQGGTIEVGLSAQTLVYDISQKIAAISVQTNQLPFPVSLEMALAGVRMVIPVGKSDTEQDFELSVALRDFNMSDMIWGVFDPAGTLPRDPATLVLEMAGKAKVLYNLLDPEVTARLEETETAPGELNALTIRNLLVSVVGARLTGTGDFTFDNSDLETFDGMPRPTGYVDLQLVGGNGVVDKLIEMGLLSNSDAMGARMMMGMLAVPGEGPDTLNSRLEINDQGHVLANGQRIQ